MFPPANAKYTLKQRDPQTGAAKILRGYPDGVFGSYPIYFPKPDADLADVQGQLLRKPITSPRDISVVAKSGKPREPSQKEWHEGAAVYGRDLGVKWAAEMAEAKKTADFNSTSDGDTSDREYRLQYSRSTTPVTRPVCTRRTRPPETGTTACC